MIRTHTPAGLAACHPHSAFSSHTLCLAGAKAHTQRHLVAQRTSGHVCSQLPVTTFAGIWSSASFLQGSGMTVLSGSHVVTRWTLSSPCLQTPRSPVHQHYSVPSHSFLLTSGLICPSLWFLPISTHIPLLPHSAPFAVLHQISLAPLPLLLSFHVISSSYFEVTPMSSQLDCFSKQPCIRFLCLLFLMFSHRFCEFSLLVFGSSLHFLLSSLFWNSCCLSLFLTSFLQLTSIK